jgi:DNA helicase TIP49 (TBP-interacting protein)
MLITQPSDGIPSHRHLSFNGRDIHVPRLPGMATGEAGMASQVESSLIGREREQQIHYELIEHVNDHGAAMLVRSDAGVGKLALHAAMTVSTSMSWKALE